MNEFLNVHQQEALLSQPKPQFSTELRNLVFLHLSLNNGVEMEGLLNLVWNQIDISGSAILICVPENDFQHRMVIHSESLVSLLNEWKETQLLEWRNDTYAPSTPEERPENVFTDLDGHPLDKEYMLKMMVIYFECAGIKNKKEFLTEKCTERIDISTPHIPASRG